jgi:hypothetical protein
VAPRREVVRFDDVEGYAADREPATVAFGFVPFLSLAVSRLVLPRGAVAAIAAMTALLAWLVAATGTGLTTAARCARKFLAIAQGLGRGALTSYGELDGAQILGAAGHF